MTMRVLIVDDEPPARELIATLLRQESDVTVVGECGDGRSAVAAIQRHTPDLVFLDVQMPRLDGFGVLAALAPEHWPLVVFVTAYDEHALRAFEVHALDYLLKPFEYGRLHESVQRARACLDRHEDTAQQARLLTLVEEWQRTSQTWERIAIRQERGVTFIKPDDIDWIEADGNYLCLHAGKKSYLLRETMSAAEARLAAKKFLRLGRSVLVNLERVKEWQPLCHGDSVVILEDGTRLTVSRVYRENLDRLVSRTFNVQ